MTTAQPDQRRRSFRPYVGAAATVTLEGFLALLAFPFVVTSISLLIIWVGIPMLAVSIGFARGIARRHRRLIERVLEVPAADPYRPVEGRLLERLRGELTQSATYRDLLWLILAAFLGFPLGLVALIFFLILPLGVVASPVMVRTYLTIAAFVLARSREAALTQRITELSTSRAETVDAQAAEIRRIERDLHDGAQARLVAMSMNLGLAEKLMESDPEAGRELIEESRHSVSEALADLRNLVRGIHPPVLADRGLAGGLEALALAAPLHVETDLVLAGRAPAPVESAVYFAVSEALTNAAKHSQAASAWIWLRHANGRLSLSVGDNGIGGARNVPGGGLYGIERRLAAFDGTMTVASPVGGPTVLSLELPCELSSEKI